MQIRKTLINFDVILAAISLAMLWGTIIVQVILRQVFKAPLMGAEEMTCYLVACIIITPIGFTEKEHGHIVMEELQAILPAAIRKIIRFIIAVSSTIVYIIITLSVYYVIHNNMRNMTQMLKMPFWLFFLPCAVGFAWISLLCVIRNFCFLLKKELPWESR